MNSPSHHTKFKVIAGYVLLFILTIATITFIYKQISRFTDKENFVSATNQKLYTIGNTIASLYEAETLSNSFLQTGSESSFQKYVGIIRQVELNIDSLKYMANEPGQKARIDTINLLLNDKIKNLKELLKVKQSKTKTNYYNRAIAMIESAKDSIPAPLDIRKRIITTRDSLYITTMKRKKGFLGLFSSKEPDSTLQVRESKHIIWDTLPATSRSNSPDSIVNILRFAWEDFQAESADINRQISRREYNIVNQSVRITEQLKKVLHDYEKEEIAYSLKRIEEQEQIMDSSARLIAAIAIIAVLFIAFFCTLILKDISRNQRYRRQLEEANAYAAQLLKSREQLMLTVTHDIKSPLSSIMGYIELLDSSQIDNRQRYFLKNMKSSSGHIQQLITNLLDLSKLENNRLNVEEVIFNPARLFHEIAGTFLPLATAKNLKLDCHIDEALEVNGKGDALRIRQILTNILSNAVKYTERGTISFTATDSAKNHRVIFEIKDSGPGMTPEEQELIFQEFTRLKSHSSTEGTGLGLTITLKLIQLLGGEMKLESEPGKGSCFKISLPLHHTAADTDSTAETGAVLLPPAGKNKERHIKILLIDDDPLQLEMTSGLLQNYGIESECTDNPKKVTGKLESEHYDMVFSDIQMPDMTGFELIRQIREHYPTIPVIALSADSGKTETDYLNAGFTAYLGKPFTASQLLQVIYRIFPDNLPDKHRPILPPLSQEHPSFAYSLKQIQQFTDNDPEATLRILHSFISETHKHLQELKAYADEKQTEKISRLAHKMLPMFRQLETEEIIGMLQTLERMSPSTEEAEKLVGEVAEKTQTLLRSLETDLDINTV